jgi:hypothetical protein
MVPGSPRNWIAVNAVQQSTLKKSNYDNSTFKKIRRPVASAAWFPSPLAYLHPRVACAFADNASG